MAHEARQVGGWLIDGFAAIVVLWVWVGAVLLHGAWRSTLRPDPDPIRPAGPTGG